jgi:DNA modification methylase
MVKYGFAAKHDYGLHERREKGEEVSNCHPLGKNPGDVFMEKTENTMSKENTESMENYDADEFKEEVDNLKKNVYGKDKANRSRVLAFLNTKKDSSTNPLGKNPGDVFREDQTLKLEKIGKRIKLSDIEETNVGEPLENRKYAKIEKATLLGQRKSLNERMNKARELGSGHDTGLNHPAGKNPGDVFEGEADIFEINTRPFAKAHFATFPPALPEKILKASCPKEVCKKCGKPREPITEIIGHAEKKIVGYTECSCKAGFEAGTVLDPFFGAGTVGVVAEELHLNWIGIELKQEYADLATERLKPYMDQHKIGDN